MSFGGGSGFSPSRTIVESSTKTGNDASQKHQFTGSVEISGGPLKLNGASITAGGGGGTPGGSDTQIQYNNGGAFGGASGLIYDDVNNRVGIGVADPDSKIEILSTTTQQKWSYDADSFATLTVADASEVTVATGESGNLILDAGGDIRLNAAGGDISFRENAEVKLIFDMDTAGGTTKIYSGVAGDDLIFGTAPGGAGNVLTIKDDGKVGLGLNDPDSTLEIFSATTQQKWSYDADSFATITVADGGDTTIATSESGDLVLDPGAGAIFFERAGNRLRFDMSTGTSFIQNDIDNGNIGFRINTENGAITEMARFEAAGDGAFLMNAAIPIQFRDTATQINSPSANVLTLTGPTVDVAGTFSLNSSNVTSTAPELNLLDASTVTAPAEGVWAGVERVAVLDIGASEYTVAAHTLGVTIPDKAIITRAILDVGTAFTSAGTPTLGLQTTGNIFPEPGSAAAQIDFFSNLGGSSNVPFALLAAQYSMDLVFSGGKLNGASTLTFTVAGANPLTAGAAKVYVYYIMGS